MAAAEQLDFLAGDRPALPVTRELRPRLQAWAERRVYFGGSSWKYEGWLGQVYSVERYQTRGRFSKPKFERECLAEYAQTFPTVCGDFAFYQFYGDKFWAKLFAQVPASFRFGFKAPEQITCPAFPNHPRYGAHAGQTNADFLNAELFQREFLDRLAPYRPQVGYVVLEFPQFHRATAATNAAFLDQLDQFLGKVAGRLPLGVEIRTRSLLGKDYLACLRAHRVGHVFNAWTHMPAIGDQLKLAEPFTGPTVVARALLQPGRTYEQAVTAFQPYQEIRDSYPAGYRDLARLVTQAKRHDPPSYVYLAVNNRFVGNSIHAIREVLDELERPPSP